jgi:ketosteroid isomerase-like protein
MKQITIALLAAFSFAACTNSTTDQKTTANQKNSEDHSSEVAAIMKADSAWAKASEAKSVEGWLSFYSDDAILMPPNEKVCTDKASRETSVKNMFAIPGMSLTFQTTKAEVSRSGDLGYAVGLYQWSSKDAKGNDYHETGKYSETWKKQSDGSWKCIADIWNSDPPTTK